MNNRFVMVGLALGVSSCAFGWDAADATDLRLDQIGVLRIVYSPSSGTADVDGNGAVAVDDLLLVLGNYGQTGPNEADINDDGIVNVDDLLMVIGAWGPC